MRSRTDPQTSLSRLRTFGGSTRPRYRGSAADVVEVTVGSGAPSARSESTRALLGVGERDHTLVLRPEPAEARRSTRQGRRDAYRRRHPDAGSKSRVGSSEHRTRARREALRGMSITRAGAKVAGERRYGVNLTSGSQSPPAESITSSGRHWPPREKLRGVFSSRSHRPSKRSRRPLLPEAKATIPRR